MNDRFRELIGQIEAALRIRLRLPRSNRDSLSSMIVNYLDRNRFWEQDGRDLDGLREIRNYLTHDRNHRLGDPVVVTERTIQRLREIHEGLLNPRPVSEQFSRQVISVRSGDVLSDVLRIAFERSFSQFPVIDNERFNRVITENEITRWLGHQINNGQTIVDLSQITVRQVLRERETDRGIIFRFAGLDAPETEVMSLFSIHPELEVVLLTESGNRNDPLEGIITQWDAARYAVV